MKFFKLFFVAIAFLSGSIPTLALGTIQTSAGFMQHDIKDLSDDPRGITLSVGKVFSLNKDFTMRPTLDFSYLSKSIDIKVNDFPMATYKLKDYSYGFSQRFSYKLPIDVKSFIFADLGAGVSFASAEYNSVFGDNEKESKDLFYYKYDIGMQVLADSGIGGEFKYGYKRNKEYRGGFFDVSFVYTL